MTPEQPAGSDRAYERSAGSAALVAGIGGIVYSIAFLGGVVAGWAPQLGIVVASVALMIGALLSIAVLLAVFRRLAGDDAAVGLFGLVLVVIGAAGAMAHGGYDLANAIHPPLSDVLGDAQLPNPVDPRGLLTFGASGLGLLVLAALARRSRVLPGGLATLGMVVGALLIVVYLGRLIILTPTNPVVAAAAGVTGLILSPAFYLWLGMQLRRR
ncbi:MAG TPA: hypothetical protein VIA82_11755 [Candidatus Limnocylindria bacterium]|jgi:hypothetical protein